MGGLAPSPTLQSESPAGIDGFPGPYAVGRYAIALRDRLRGLARVCLVGELSGVRLGNGPNVYFELRDGDGGVPCAMWRTDFDRLTLAAGALRDGAEMVVAGGCDYYPGSSTASPRFTFRVSDMRPAGEGDLLARLERLRHNLAGEGLFERQKRLRVALLPRVLGVVTAEGSAACRDFLAALERRGWRGSIVWGYAPVQDRRAAPRIAAAVRDLAGVAQVETIVVTRGGGSIADLWAFCDETLCRTIALLPVPVISAVGHEVDRTLIDDVSAVCCSTPTHAAEVAVGVDCTAARIGASRAAGRLEALGRTAVLSRARALGAHSRAPRAALAGHRRRLHQHSRELRAATRRGVADRAAFQQRVGGTVLGRKLEAARGGVVGERGALRARTSRLELAGEALAARREQALLAHAAGLRASDPDRTLERGFALVLDASGEPLETADAVRAAERFDLQLAGGRVGARVSER